MHLIQDGRLTFDPRGDKTVELLASRLMDTEGNLNDLQAEVTKMRKSKDESQKEWKGWRQIESDALEVKVSKAVCQKLDKDSGEIILTSYSWKGTNGDLDGLVIGNLEGHPIYVLVEAKHNMDANRRKASEQLLTSSRYFDECLLSETRDNDEQAAKEEEDRIAVQIDKLKDRTRYWAFGGVQFKHPDKLGMRGKGCFMVQPNHEMQYEVVSIEKHESL